MRNSVAAHESLRRDSRVVLPRVGVGVGGGDGWGAIHASRLTSAAPRSVDNGTASSAQTRDAWMALRAIGGGQ